MPFAKVMIEYHPVLRVTDVLAAANGLSRVVAEALACDNPDDGHLAQSDVEIASACMSPWCGDRYLVRVTIDAEDFPERRKNLDERRKRIAIELSRKFSPLWPAGTRFKPKGLVIIHLIPTSCGEF